MLFSVFFFFSGFHFMLFHFVLQNKFIFHVIEKGGMFWQETLFLLFYI